MSATHIDNMQAKKAGLTDLSRSIAHLDVAGLIAVGALAVGIARLKQRVEVSRSTVLALLGGFASLTALVLRLGVTDKEVRRALPGDNLIPQSYVVTDRAITVKAPPEEVWPWVAQMGYHRGGWYTSRRLDRILWHIDNPSEDRIVPEYQNVRAGDIIPDGEPGTAYFTIAEIEKNRHIVYLDATGSHVRGTTFTWSFVLRPRGDGTTRIQVRWRNGPVSSVVLRVAVLLLVAPADFVMMNQVLGGIKRRAERGERGHVGASEGALV